MSETSQKDLNPRLRAQGSRNVGSERNLGEAAPKLQVHDVVQPELGQAPVDVVPEHRGVGDQPSCCDEGLLKLLPHHLLAGVLALRILGEQRQMLHQTKKDH